MFKSLLFLLSASIAVATSAATFTVTNINDSGTGSLRQAISDANASPGMDIITFNISGTGPFLIQPITSLPAITEPVNLNGYTQPGSTPPGATTPAVIMIGLSGANLSGGTYTLLSLGTGATGSAISGIAFQNYSCCGNTGLTISASNVNVIGNTFGLNTAGTANSGMNNGIKVYGSGVQIGGSIPSERNVFGGNANQISVWASNTEIKGNYFGTLADGTGNISFLWSAAHFNSGTGHEFGGPNAGDGNLVRNSGSNAEPAVKVSGSSTIVSIRRNSIYCTGNGTIGHDMGGNASYSAPVITSANSTVITGTGNSGDVIDIFSDDGTCTNPEMKVYLGSATVSTAGTWTFTGTFTPGHWITATATPSTSTTSQQATPFEVNGILTGALTGPLCAGTPHALSYTASGLFSGNTFIAQLSDANGTFLSPTNIGTVTSNVSGTINAVIPPSVSGTYLIRVVSTSPVINGNGVVANIQPTITNNVIGSDQTVCSGQPPSAFSGSAPLGGNGTYAFSWESSTDLVNWNVISGANSQTYTSGSISTTTYFRRIVTSGSCTSTSNLITVQVSALPGVVLGPLTPVCENTPAFNLTAGSPVGGTFSGPGIISSPLFDPSVAGPGTHLITYLYLGTNGCSGITTQTQVVNPSIQLSATSTPASCNGGSDGTATVTITSGGTAPINISWNTNPVQSGLTATGLSAGTYTATATDNIGCSSSINVVVTEPTALNADAGASSVNVCSGSNITLGGTPAATGGTGPYLYNWTPATGLSSSTIANPVGNFSASDTYYLTVTDANGCTSTDSVIVNVLALPVATTTVTDVSCNGNCDGSATVNVISGASPYTYSWSTGANTTTITGLCTGNQSVAVTDANGCQSAAAALINEPPALVVATGNDTTICDGYTANLSGTITGGTPTYTISWSPGSDLTDTTILNPVASPNVTTVYTLTVTDQNGCVTSDQVTINVNSLPTVSLTQPAPVCHLTSPVTLNTGLPVGGIYSGTGVSGGNFDPQTVSPGTYNLNYTYTDANGCTDSAQSQILVRALPVVTFAATGDFCDNDSASLLITGAPSGGSYSGQGVFNDMLYPASAGAGTHSITYTYTDSFGCQNSANLAVIVKPSLTSQMVSITSNSPVCAGEKLTLHAEAPGHTGLSYTWQGPDNFTSTVSSPEIDFFEGPKLGQYSVLIGINGCNPANPASIEPGIDPGCDVKTYNTVTPNGDGKNDQWIIEGISSFNNVQVSILNRWGDIVWKKTGYDNMTVVWKGDNNSGNTLPDGTYFYVIKAGNRELTGFIELIK